MGRKEVIGRCAADFAAATATNDDDDRNDDDINTHTDH